MKVYIASRIANQGLAFAFMSKCQSMRHLSGEEPTFLNTWQNETPTAEPSLQQHIAQRDLAQIDEADEVWVLTVLCEETTGGMNFEAGYAYAKGKRLTVIGPRVHIFYYLPDIEWYAWWSDFFAMKYVSVLDGE